MKKGDKAAIVCCSNAIPHTSKEMVKALEKYLAGMGLHPVLGDCIYSTDSVFGGSAKERARSLMRFYRDPEIKAIFDISGGDIANGVLPFLDYEAIAESGKMFWGYSDLTTVLNAIYARTGKSSVLYQIRHLSHEKTEARRRDFYNTIINGGNDLYSFSCEIVQKGIPQGIVVGGNIRCLLKLAGTGYWPDMNRKVLLLESFHGSEAQMAAYFSQLEQMGVFEQISGILLGTFTELEEKRGRSWVIGMVKQYAGSALPILKTDEIGHSIDSKGIMIGKELKINLKIL